MAPPAELLNLDVEAISGILGSISIACWVVVFSPQIIENFRRSSADGLSIQFIIIWLTGDVFNILGAVLQGVLPTMLILAIYYTIADVVLLAQCFYYRGHHLGAAGGDLGPYDGTRERRGSNWSHLSPVVPLIDPADLEADILHQPRRGNGNNRSRPTNAGPTKLQSLLFNLFAILMVCAAGVMGWFLSREYYPQQQQQPSTELPSPGSGSGPKDGSGSASGGRVEFSLWGQIYGYLSAVLYLGSRLPQLLLNFRRKSTEGVSMLFFLFACLGNLTYVLSILAYDGSAECAAGPGDCDNGEEGRIYWRYVLVNMSWLAGSAGTLFLDGAIFVQFFLYNKDEFYEDEDEEWDSGSESGSDGSGSSSVISERSGRVSDEEDGGMGGGAEQGQESDGRGWDSDDERSKLDEDEMRGRKRRAERDARVRGGVAAGAGAGGTESGRI
ncbi:hypothetical protein SMACR_06711 [Sordaria macrospora]|uniref:WGS project CABT00000000 data, contig 2.13 n=2 Tax=Sordaria macrospora TaxID=5147 RepID=F7VYE6_SORMK|nr:uncharacterized protein SMAC_06711 [Sordaria macrospora k-hell]KAA8632868.1 hypothetical protein SMACR_06711 [Sordaria macrospora]KAH7631672.1 PQ loop repeat-domain-containing protein [Sordaria sp. MPI-SDFR-AT-0083]WPJ62981.1 hypothetical protein SMAC4_06711 [Sordaria macrospora]CCC10540.1 unnamed protein product [Sordaria macrospora k-hell]